MIGLFGFTKGASAFAGGVFDGSTIWLVPCTLAPRLRGTGPLARKGAHAASRCSASAGTLGSFPCCSRRGLGHSIYRQDMLSLRWVALLADYLSRCAPHAPPPTWCCPNFLSFFSFDRWRRETKRKSSHILWTSTMRLLSIVVSLMVPTVLSAAAAALAQTILEPCLSP